MYVLVAPEPDRQSPHDDDEVYVVLEGNGVLTVGGKPVELRERHAAYVPAGAEHAFSAYEFVWADRSGHGLDSNGVNTFSVLATGGSRFVTDINAGSGAPTASVAMTSGGSLTATGTIRVGAGNATGCDIVVADDNCFFDEQNGTLSVRNATGSAFAPVKAQSFIVSSDRAVKEHVAKVDTAAVLAEMAGLPLSTWSYKTEKGVRHIGPMAQDFAKAFHVGEDSKHINLVDA